MTAARVLGHPAAVCLALAALVFAGRAWLIQAWGSPLPLLDEWDAVATLYRAWLTDTWRWADLFAPHNEHRILLTRVADLALLVVCGKWDPWSQLLLNAGLHAAIAASLAACFWRSLTPLWRVALVCGLALLFSAPSGWQNALWGFQSHVYLTHLLAVLAFAGLAFSPPGHPRHWLALAALLLGLFGNATGALAAVAALTALRPPRTRIVSMATLLAIAAIAALGLLLRVPVPQHAPLHARSFEQFFGVLAHSLSWPHIDATLGWIVMQLPLAVLCVVRWRRRQPLDSAERCALAIVTFAMLQAAAVAYSRGGGLIDLRPLSRYQDAFLLGAAAQLFVAMRLAMAHGRRGRLIVLGWTALALAGLIQLTAVNLSLHLPVKRAQDRVSLAAVQSYLTTGDESLLSFEPPFSGPHPNPAVVIGVLDDPTLRPLLDAALSPDAPRPWIVRNAASLTCAALLLLVLCLGLSARRASQRANPTMTPQPGS